MNETYRVLKRGGKFTFQFIVGDEREPLSNHYGIDEMVEMMHKSGFKTVWNKPSVAHELWLMMGATKE
jgi:ubiquinone/menaquinone biosynthesis C-methylase UbiE